jgi:hypothetical protein
MELQMSDNAIGIVIAAIVFIITAGIVIGISVSQQHTVDLVKVCVDSGHSWVIKDPYDQHGADWECK